MCAVRRVFGSVPTEVRHGESDWLVPDVPVNPASMKEKYAGFEIISYFGDPSPGFRKRISAFANGPSRPWPFAFEMSSSVSQRGVPSGLNAK